VFCVRTNSDYRCWRCQQWTGCIR